MVEITISNQAYQFNFGIGFLREMNKKVIVPVDGLPGVKKNVGFKYAVAKILDGDVEALIDVLDIANKDQTPRLIKPTLESHIDDEDTDIDALFSDVLGFLENSNATRKETSALLKAAEREEAKQEEMEQLKN